MANHKYTEIAKMFGLELDEVFQIKGVKGEFKFDPQGLVSEDSQGKWLFDSTILRRLLSGDLEVVRPPYRPQTGDFYWSYIYSGWVVAGSDWIDDAVDHARLEAGMVFRTQEEALDARAELYKKVTGKEYNSNDYR